MRWWYLPTLCTVLCVATACSLTHQWTSTGKAVETLAERWSGTATNLSDAILQAKAKALEDAVVWHKILNGVLGITTMLALAIRKNLVDIVRDIFTQKPKRRLEDETV